MYNYMKRFFLYFFTFLFSANLLFAQMTDDQVVSYVKSEAERGTSQQSIATELAKRGVTQSQVERINNQINQQKQASSSSINQASLSASPLRSDFLDETSSVNIESKDNDGGSNIFGRNIFNKKNLTFAPNVNIPTPENYELGPGDEVVIDVWGASQASVRQTISPEGSIVVDRIGPIFLNGMTIKEANVYVQQKFASLYAGIGDYEGTSQIKLTLGQIRTIQINIMGEVAIPGTYSMSSLSSIFHALYNAGGINNIGSLRNVQLYRKGKLLETVDIYQYILKGNFSSDIRLMDGDVIVVPPYSSLVEISGKVRRPMFYEMTPQETITDLINYSGDFTGDAYREKISLTRKTGEYDKVFTLSSDNFSSFILNDGDNIVISSGLNKFDNKAEIHGAVFRPGSYEVGKDIVTVKDMIEKAGGVKEDVFLNRAVLTREKDDLTIENLSINLGDLLSGKIKDISLRKNDVLFIASNSVLNDLGNLAIYGNVVSPGSYRYADNTTIEDLIVKAGGLLGSASIVKVDVARRIVDPTSTETPTTIAETFQFSIKDGLIVDGKSDFTLKPYDQVYVRRSPGYIEQRNVAINGEVLFPGTYALKEKEERLSDIIKRAGETTRYAYLQGARLIRMQSEEEVARQKKTIQTISERGSKDSISSELVDVSRFYSIGIELDKAMADPKSDYDLVLKPGDRLIIPEFDNTIKINGAVMYPNTVLYKKGEKVSFYIDQAGGYSDLAEKKRAYIVYMNGTVTKAKGSNKNVIQPGCEIIIPSKERKEKMTLAETISIGTSVTSMASVVALLVNALTK